MVGIPEPCRLQSSLSITTSILSPKAKVVQFEAKGAIMDKILSWHQAKSFDHIAFTNDRLNVDYHAMIYSGTNQAKKGIMAPGRAL